MVFCGLLVQDKLNGEMSKDLCRLSEEVRADIEGVAKYRQRRVGHKLHCSMKSVNCSNWFPRCSQILQTSLGEAIKKTPGIA